MKIIPLHTLVILVGNESERSNLANMFPEHEVISQDQIRYDLVGNDLRPHSEWISQQEFIRRIHLKLKLGERVVVEDQLNRNIRNLLINEATNNGCNVQSISFRDGEDINVSKEKISIIKAPVLDMTKGLTIIGDIHGEIEPLRMAVEWAESRNHLPIFVGDILDYGENSLETIETVYNLIVNGNALFVLGNHERKISRYLNQDHTHLHLSKGNQVTINKLQSLSMIDQKKWIGKFNALIGYSYYVLSTKNIIITHGAIHSDYWFNNTISRNVENYALRGEIHINSLPDQRPIMNYSWCDNVPANKIVIVGHDIRSTLAPIITKNKNNGIVIFLDTGCGKGGQLSSVDLKLNKNEFDISNFNLHLG